MNDPNTQYPILIIDDDKELGEMLTEYLEPEGFSAAIACRGDEGVETALQGNFRAVVLDVMLPGLNGFDVLKAIRKSSIIPVIMLTARGDDIDRILGLEMGADDYLPKPFNPRELVARLRAVIRRQSFQEKPNPGECITCHSLSLSPGSRRVEVNKQPLELTSTEFSVLEMLVRHAGHVVSKETLYEGALGRPLAAYDRSLDMHVSHLRRKLSAMDKTLVIHTVRGTGYQMQK